MTALAGRHVVVSGAGTAQGLAVARAFVEAGAAVTLPGGEDAARALDSTRARAVALGESSDAAWNGVLAGAEAVFGVPDTVVLGLPFERRVVALAEMMPERFHDGLETGFVAPALALGAAVRFFRQRRAAASIIVVCGDDARTGRAGAAVAAASSGGLLLFAKTAALECAGRKDGLRVNCLLAGEPVETDALVRGALLLASPAAGHLNGAAVPAVATSSTVK